MRWKAAECAWLHGRRACPRLPAAPDMGVEGCMAGVRQVASQGPGVGKGKQLRQDGLQLVCLFAKVDATLWRQQRLHTGKTQRSDHTFFHQGQGSCCQSRCCSCLWHERSLTSTKSAIYLKQLGQTSHKPHVH